MLAGTMHIKTGQMKGIIRLNKPTCWKWQSKLLKSARISYGAIVPRGRSMLHKSYYCGRMTVGQ